ALRLGLVDALGGQDEALQWLAGQCGVPPEHKLQTCPKEDNWLPRGLKTLLHLDVGSELNTLAKGTPAFLFQL
ncbi:MAG: signal peptide peptidase SppA, partial [Desulfovibrio sp.]|nr:signal peptide peptidase SppA [Desulfovibrio sp.]